jgi:hypothetical protein
MKEFFQQYALRGFYNNGSSGSGGGGVTPTFSIGTVETLEPGSDATASISGTKENPVLNLGIPKGLSGKTPVRGTDYWTSADIAEIKSYVDEAILGGAW